MNSHEKADVLEIMCFVIRGEEIYFVILEMNPWAQGSKFFLELLEARKHSSWPELSSCDSLL